MKVPMGAPVDALIRRGTRRSARRGARQRRPAFLAMLSVMAALTACVSRGPTPPEPHGPSAALPSGSAQPGAPPPVTGAPPEHLAPPAKVFRLGPATTALVAQAQRQAGSGDYGPAAATLERALRIEPDNPLVWVELGRVHLADGNASQADALGRKALALATGDSAAQASAWRLIAEALRARGRDADAADAERHAASLVPQ